MIEFQDVHKTYENSGVDALRGVSFHINDGEFVFLIGKSGSGKSTVMKCINCEEIPNEGAVLIDGFNISDMPRALVPVLRRQIGMIYQDFRLIETKTVFENISFAGEIIGLSKRSLYQKVQLVLKEVELKDKADAYPQELSGGEQQRVAIARAMLNNPKIIVADEPTGNLDPETSENIMGLLLSINRQGSTVIVCTHDSNLVDKMKKRVIEIEDGLVIRDKEDSSYEDKKDMSASGTAASASNISFGDDPAYTDDSAYSSGFDEDTYIEANKALDNNEFYFGETPKRVLIAAEQAAAARQQAQLQAAAAALQPESQDLPVEPDPETSISEIPLEEAALIINGEAPEEIPVDEVVPVDEAGDIPEEVTDISQLPVENEVPQELEVSEEDATPEEESQTAEVVFGDEDKSEPAPDENEPSADSDDSKDKDEDNDDNWIDEVSMDDIDLDIQEEDE